MAYVVLAIEKGDLSSSMRYDDTWSIVILQKGDESYRTTCYDH